jgi:hypothetical protein
MTVNRRLTQLSTLIHENTLVIDAYMKDNGIPEPSFEPTTPPILHLPPEVDTSRIAALEALDELRDHLLGPVGMITNSVTDVSTPSSYIAILANYG